MTGLRAAPAAVHHQPSPDARTAFVFICPGRHEANRGYPCAAGTGANLQRVLPKLQARAPTLFPSPDRAAYVITNAWAQVEYPALTGRSVPEAAEVAQPEVLARLWSELAGVERVVACGAQAHVSLDALAAWHAGQPAPGAPFPQVAKARHLSQRAVNMLPGGDTDQRLDGWADGVARQFQPQAAR